MLNIPVTKAFIPFLVPGTVNVCVRLYEKPTKNQIKRKAFFTLIRYN